MTRLTKNELKRLHKEEVAQLKTAIWLKCGDCLGFFLDPYEPCTSKTCPLRKFYPKAGTVRSRVFKQQLAALAKEYGNDTNLVERIQSLASNLSISGGQNGRKGAGSTS